MERRNTIQRDLVLDAVKSLHNHATADEIYEYIIKTHPTVGRGTVYRNLNILVDEGSIKRAPVLCGPDHFDHNVHEHYHVKCVKCGKVYDVDMDVIPDVTERIHDTHGMKYLNYDILFNGVCAACQE